MGPGATVSSRRSRNMPIDLPNFFVVPLHGLNTLDNPVKPFGESMYNEVNNASA
jgi:hypothetical protein